MSTRAPSRPRSHSRYALAAAALLFAGGSSPALAGGDCFTPSGSPSCDNAAISSCVCAFDSYCCQYAWDSICVSEAVNQCGASNGGGGHIDSDGDGLSDEYEYQLGTNPYLTDTDRDLLNDALEVSLGLDPTNYDTDGDGIPDGIEEGLDGTLQPTDPNNADTDGDGISDRDEIALQTRVIFQNQETGMLLQEVTLVVYPSSQKDTAMEYPAPSQRVPQTATIVVQRDAYNAMPYLAQDTIMGEATPTQKKEILDRMTLPYLSDSDFDLLSDGLEKARKTNPLKADTDGDKIPDGLEDFFVGRDPMPLGPITEAGDGKLMISETDPRNPDTDGDGLSDGAEAVLYERYVEDPVTQDILLERKLVAYPPVQFDSGFPPSYERAPQVVTIMVRTDPVTRVESIAQAVMVTEPAEQERYVIQNVLTYAFSADSDGDGHSDKKDPCPNSAEDICK